LEIEYKHVRVSYTLLSLFSKKYFDKQLMEILNEHGAAGWKLQGVIHESIFAGHYHMIFMKETE
jgi:hypothetical protein